ncbi:MAG: DMT family transporter [Pirellulaceae bacterium]
MNAFKAEKPLAVGVSGSAFLLGNILCWAAVPVLLRYLTSALDAWTANGIRYPLAAAFFLPLLIVAWRSRELSRTTLVRCIVPSLLAFGGQVLWGLAPYYLPASAIGFLMRSSLVFSLAAAMLWFPDERRLLKQPFFYVGLILSVVGFLLLSASKVQSDAEVTAVGILVALGCSMFYGFYGVSVRHFLQRTNPVLSSGVVSVFVSFGTVIVMLCIGDYWALARVSSSDWIVIVVSSIVGITLGHYFLYAAVPRLGAAVSSAAQTLTPFLTMVLAAWFLGESMNRLEWSAGMMMVVGAAVLLWAHYSYTKSAVAVQS